MKNPEVHEGIKEEGRKFLKNILNIDKLMHEPDKAPDKQILLTKEDLICKFLNYIEYWKEKLSPKNTVIFILKFLRHIIERGGS